MTPRDGSSKPLAVDLFAGAGGTTLALKRAGFEVPVAVEIDPTKATTLHANQPRTSVLGLLGTVGDVRNVQPADIYSAGLPRNRRLQLLVACPPCQGYSTQGKQNPRDSRNKLFVDVLRLAEALNPRAVVIENVPGMATTAGGMFLSQLLSGLEGLNYSTNVWKIRASRLGVPQDRERLFIIASRTHVQFPHLNPRAPSTWDAIADLPALPFKALDRRGRPAKYKRLAVSSYARNLRGQRTRVTGVEKSRHTKKLVRRVSRLGWGKQDAATKHRRLHPHEPAVTITAGTRSRTACRPIHPYQARTLTVREAARLASFPDWYRFPSVISEAWNEIGNAVPPLMAKAVFSRVRQALRAA